MGFFKIRNITSLLGKRDAKFNTTLPISMSSQFKKDKFSLAPDAEFVLEANFLPIELHKLRSENFVSILEISKDAYLAAVGEDTKKKLNSQIAENKEVLPIVEKKTPIIKKKEFHTTSTTEK